MQLLVDGDVGVLWAGVHTRYRIFLSTAQGAFLDSDRNALDQLAVGHVTLFGTVRPTAAVADSGTSLAPFQRHVSSLLATGCRRGLYVKHK